MILVSFSCGNRRRSSWFSRIWSNCQASGPGRLLPEQIRQHYTTAPRKTWLDLDKNDTKNKEKMGWMEKFSMDFHPGCLVPDSIKLVTIFSSAPLTPALSPRRGERGHYQGSFFIPSPPMGERVRVRGNNSPSKLRPYRAIFANQKISLQGLYFSERSMASLLSG